jgi:hypothetical protein
MKLDAAFRSFTVTVLVLCAQGGYHPPPKLSVSACRTTHVRAQRQLLSPPIPPARPGCVPLEPPPYNGSAGLPVGIPRVVHQVWISTKARKKGVAPTMPPKNLRSSRSWSTLMPSFEHRLWGNEDVRSLIGAHVPWLLPVYDSYPLDIMRVDAARYVIMSVHGGWYTDSDNELLKPLPAEWFGTAETQLLFVSFTGGCSIRQDQFGSAPRHPFWALVLDALVHTARISDVMYATGPNLLHRVYSLARVMRMPHKLLAWERFKFDDQVKVCQGFVYERTTRLWDKQLRTWVASSCAMPPANCSAQAAEEAAGAIHPAPDKARHPCLVGCLRAYGLLAVSQVPDDATLQSAEWTRRVHACADPQSKLPTIREMETPPSCGSPSRNSESGVQWPRSALKAEPTVASASWSDPNGAWTGWRIF